MATINSLANETLTHIMELLKEPSTLDWDNLVPEPGRYDTLRAAALVCSRWRDPAQRALFDDVELSNRYPLRAERFLSSPAQPRYRTTSLYAARSMWPTPRPDSSESSHASNDEWLDVARACKTLRMLEIIWGSGNFQASHLAESCLAELKHLGIYAYRIIRDRDARAPAQTRLSFLALRSDMGAGAVLAAVSESSSQTLKKIRLGQKAGERLPTALGPCLLALELEGAGLRLQSFLEFLADATSLESLSMGGLVDYDHESSLPVKTFQACLDALPSTPTLRHLSIGTSDFSFIEHTITKFLEHPSLSLITKLDFPEISSRMLVGRALLVVLMTEACLERGIQWSMGGLEMTLLRANSIASGGEVERDRLARKLAWRGR
ncbi:hypothetical protein RQP46_004351 [Phenoliferia psychrophenolica]